MGGALGLTRVKYASVAAVATSIWVSFKSWKMFKTVSAKKCRLNLVTMVLINTNDERNKYRWISKRSRRIVQLWKSSSSGYNRVIVTSVLDTPCHLMQRNGSWIINLKFGYDNLGRSRIVRSLISHNIQGAANRFQKYVMLQNMIHQT